jgi:hypothetical protein
MFYLVRVTEKFLELFDKARESSLDLSKAAEALKVSIYINDTVLVHFFIFVHFWSYFTMAIILRMIKAT